MEYTQEMKELIAAICREQGKREKGEKLERYRRLNRYVKPGLPVCRLQPDGAVPHQ